MNSPHVRFLYCTPHTFYFGDDTVAMLRECADVLAHVHMADTFNHKASSGLRYIINPPGSTARVHQHLNIGQGEVPWDDFFRTLHEIGFDGIMTACVFAWEEKADESGKFMRGRDATLHRQVLGREMSLQIGFIGAGMMGQDHIRRLTQVLSGVTMVAITDIDRSRATAAAPQGAEVFDTPQLLIRSDKVRAVVICSWGPAHEEQILECIAAGKPSSAKSRW